ncbi:MAG: carbohydrate ABC transporter permease [Spirochaetaceae bacterium]|jgi:ABC-type glycerol-3-phosphate transport system permease component|nr:carbohydrate ABC transporter permease [Spirochaetaceae bacterium]
MKLTVKKRIFDVSTSVVGIIIVFIIVFPIFWMVRSSLLQTVYVYQTPPVLIFKPTLSAFIRVFTRQNYALRFMNSAFISIVTTVFALFFGSMAAYGISRYPLPGARSMPMIFLFLRMLPTIATLAPVFLMFNALHLIDTYRGLISLYITGAISMVVWMMWGFFYTLPKEIEESAFIDGCGPFRAFISIVIPMSTPSLAALGILSFTGAWNEFMMSIILTRRHVITLPPGIKFLMSQADLSWDMISAAGTIVSIPILIFCLAAQKYFIGGLTLGAVKG